MRIKYETERQPILVMNPAHGNEPYILATKLGLAVNSVLEAEGFPSAQILVPHLYGNRQKKILKEEVGDARAVLLDQDFGQRLSSINFTNEGYAAHLQRINTYHAIVTDSLNQKFGGTDPISAERLDDSSLVTLNPQNIIASIDTGARITLPVPQRFFCFPVILSELLRASKAEQKDGNPQFNFDLKDLETVEQIMASVEARYSAAFVPQISTLTAIQDSPYKLLGTGNTKVTLTPPLKEPLSPKPSQVDKKGIYLMYSGTEIDQSQNGNILQVAYDSGLEIYIPPWIDIKPPYVEGFDFIKRPPSIMSDPNIIGVAGRAGWGTGWQTQQLGKPWFVHPYQTGDDPEMYFNNQTISALQIGQVLDEEISDPEQIVKMYANLAKYSNDLYIGQTQKELFKTIDGIAFVAKKIAEKIKPDLAAFSF